MQTLKNIGNGLLGCFLAGVFAILPLVVTVAVVIWIVGFLQRYLGPRTTIGTWVQYLGLRFPTDNQVLTYVLGWLIVLSVVFLLGVAVKVGARRLMQSLTDRILERIPVIGSIYNTSKQMVGMLDRQDQADLKGMSVVYCMFGGDHGAGVLALLVSPQTYHIAGKDYNIVIIPTAPVPFGGALLFAPTETVIDAKMSVDGLMSTYVSMGLTAPRYMKEHLGKAEP
ncbi:MAG: DUF502 domain-containing protein [Planctomycetota bacterium]